MMFVRAALIDVSLTIQLGHADGSYCSNPVPPRQGFCVVDTNGHHTVAIRFCRCNRTAESGSPMQQLLRRDLYSATHLEPHTAFTFRLMEHYHIQSLQGKISMYDYYESLERMADNTGTHRVPARYKEFMRVATQWRHLKMLKRAGRGHDPTGVNGTRDGELAIRCPACPRPDVNLPENWQAKEKEFQYVLIYIIIRQQRQLICQVSICPRPRHGCMLPPQAA